MSVCCLDKETQLFVQIGFVWHRKRDIRSQTAPGTKNWIYFMVLLHVLYVLLKLSVEGVAFKPWKPGILDTSFPHYFIVMLTQMIFIHHVYVSSHICIFPSELLRSLSFYDLPDCMDYIQQWVLSICCMWHILLLPELDGTYPHVS